MSSLETSTKATVFGLDSFDQETTLSKHALKLNNNHMFMLCVLDHVVRMEIAPLDYASDLTGGAIVHIVICDVPYLEVLRPARPPVNFKHSINNSI